MSLLSTLDDFLNRTLSAVPGLLARVEYVSSLRKDGRYAHWGLSRVHGEHAAEQCISSTHKTLIAEVLKTPLRVLAKDNENSCVAEGREADRYLEELEGRKDALLPATPGRASELHFSSVLHALWALARSQRNATPPNA